MAIVDIKHTQTIEEMLRDGGGSGGGGSLSKKTFYVYTTGNVTVEDKGVVRYSDANANIQYHDDQGVVVESLPQDGIAVIEMIWIPQRLTILGGWSFSLGEYGGFILELANYTGSSAPVYANTMIAQIAIYGSSDAE